MSLLNLPKEIIDLFNMEACRGKFDFKCVSGNNLFKIQSLLGAIKFGDELNRDRCVFLIKELSNCRLPFQCAHGRPTVLPLTNVFIKKVNSFEINFYFWNKILLFIFSSKGKQNKIGF